MNNIEVELRGPVNESDYTELIEYLKTNGVHTSTQKRLFFDLSQTVGINNRTLDVRAKVTNGNIQIVVKKGEPGSSGREEGEVKVEAGNLKEALHVLALLGYPKGVYGDRKIERYQIGNIEFAVQDVINITNGTLHSRFYEAEAMASLGNEDKAETELRAKLSELNLPVFDTEGWNLYETTMNKEANSWFDFSTTDISHFT